MADPNMDLPPEYLAEIQAAQKRQALANALLTKGMGFTGEKSQGRLAARTSLGTLLAANAGGMLGGLAGEEAQGAINATRERAGNAQRAELLRMQGLPETERINSGLASRWSGVRAEAGAQRKISEERRGKAIGAAGAAGDVQAAVDLAGGMALSDFKPPTYKDAEIFEKDGQKYVRNFDNRGRPTVTPVRSGVTVNNVIPGDEAKLGLSAFEAGFKPRQEGADAAKNVFTATTRAVDALQRGAQAGGLENSKQFVRSVLQGMGVNTPATAETAELSMTLGNALLAEASKIKPISNNDIDTLRGIVGQIATDPEALSRALAYSQAISFRALKQYGQYVDEQAATVKTPAVQERLSGAKVGYDAPTQFTGPLAHQLEVIRQLQLAGEDITGFNDPATGKPFDPRTRIQVNPAGGYPGVQSKLSQPAGKKETPPAKAYTDPQSYARALSEWVNADRATRGPQPTKGF